MLKNLGSLSTYACLHVFGFTVIAPMEIGYDSSCFLVRFINSPRLWNALEVDLRMKTMENSVEYMMVSCTINDYKNKTRIPKYVEATSAGSGSYTTHPHHEHIISANYVCRRRLYIFRKIFGLSGGITNLHTLSTTIRSVREEPMSAEGHSLTAGPILFFFPWRERWKPLPNTHPDIRVRVWVARTSD